MNAILYSGLVQQTLAVRHALINSHVLRNSDFRMEMLNKNEIIFVCEALYHTNAALFLQPNQFPMLSSSVTKLNINTMYLLLH